MWLSRDKKTQDSLALCKIGKNCIYTNNISDDNIASNKSDNVL